MNKEEESDEEEIRELLRKFREKNEREQREFNALIARAIGNLSKMFLFALSEIDQQEEKENSSSVEEK